MMINFCTVTFAMMKGVKRMSVMSFVNLINLFREFHLPWYTTHEQSPSTTDGIEQIRAQEAG